MPRVLLNVITPRARRALKAEIEHLRHGKREKPFDMGEFLHPCGAPGCLAGDLAYAAGAKRNSWQDDSVEWRGHDMHCEQAVRKALGLSVWQATLLFYLVAWPKDLAARYMRATNEVARREISAVRLERFLEATE